MISYAIRTIWCFFCYCSFLLLFCSVRFLAYCTYVLCRFVFVLCPCVRPAVLHVLSCPVYHVPYHTIPYPFRPLAVVLMEASEDTLVRHLTLWDLVVIGVAGTIGSGIFAIVGLIGSSCEYVCVFVGCCTIGVCS